jgi:predicted RNase H-like HicB family nuclease
MMVAVVALLHGEPGAYGISFPDFQGCISGGASVDEALRRGRETLTFHVENMIDVGEALPKVRDVAEIKADPGFLEDFSDAIVAVVDVELPSRSVRVNISIDERLLERIDQTAASAGETRSGFIAEAARQRLSAATNAYSASSFSEAPAMFSHGDSRKRSTRLSRPKSRRRRPATQRGSK